MVINNDYVPRIIMDDGKVENGPVNLTNKARQEVKHWVFNKEVTVVHKSSRKPPEEIYKENGLHTRSLVSRGIERHVLCELDDKVGLSGGISTTKKKNAEDTMGYKAVLGDKCNIYRITLQPGQGMDALSTFEKIKGNDLIPYIVKLEEEITVIGSIALDQMEYLNPLNNQFISVREHVEQQAQN